MTANNIFKILFITLLLLFIVAVGQAFFLVRTRVENRALQQGLDYLQASMGQEQERLRLQTDSLQQGLARQGQENQNLKSQLSQLENKHQQLNLQFHEKQILIYSITDADSIYREIARHYGR